jgi:hypothetical protein
LSELLNADRPAIFIFFIVAFAFIILGLSAAGCAVLETLRDGRVTADKIAQSHGWQKLPFDTPAYVLTGYAKFGAGADLTVYVEGDGRAFVNRRTPSIDPTPRNPLMLRLAVADPAAKILYLGRPCQYVSKATMKNCYPKVWTISRFSAAAVDSMSQALNAAKVMMEAEQLHLIGYSGGGAMAVLLAAVRGDVKTIITVAGNLDHRLWTDHHRLTPLWDSLNPSDFACQVQRIPQIHLMGEEDEITPPFLAQAFIDRMENKSLAKVIAWPQFDHACCWVSVWAKLLADCRSWLMTAVPSASVN